MQIAYNRTARTQKPMYIVIHDTGNTGRGADAESHFKYFNGGNRGASADFFIDDKQALQVNDYNKYYTWHCGDGRGKYGITNANSVGIEICVNSDGDYKKAVENTVRLTKRLMAELNISADHVVRHYDASRKNCPASMSANGWALWEDFKDRISGKGEELTMGQYEELKKRLDELEAKCTAADAENERQNIVIGAVGEDIQTLFEGLRGVTGENYRQNDIIDMIGQDIAELQGKGDE